MLQTNAEFLI